MRKAWRSKEWRSKAYREGTNQKRENAKDSVETVGDLISMSFDGTDLRRELETAKAAARAAGAAIMDVYSGDFSVEFKDDKSPLTEADRRANAMITKQLISAFPDYAMLSEESKDDRNRLGETWCWVVDPLDGTKEFVKRNGEFTVNIALACNQRVVLGVVYAPVTGDLYSAAKGLGAHRQQGGDEEPIKVSARTSGLRIVMSRSHASDREQHLLDTHSFAEVRRIGSSLKGCLIAAGEAEVYYRFGPTMEWDTAAMHCVVEQAGGTVKQLDGSELLYNRENSLNEKGFYVVNNPENYLLAD